MLSRRTRAVPRVVLRTAPRVRVRIAPGTAVSAIGGYCGEIDSATTIGDLPISPEKAASYTAPSQSAFPMPHLHAQYHGDPRSTFEGDPGLHKTVGLAVALLVVLAAGASLIVSGLL